MLLEFDFSELDKETEEKSSTEDVGQGIEKGNVDAARIVQGKLIFVVIFY